MKKLLTLVTTLLLGSLSFAQNHNALRFRQPLAFHQYLIRDLHQQTLERDRSRQGKGTLLMNRKLLVAFALAAFAGCTPEDDVDSR